MKGGKKTLYLFSSLWFLPLVYSGTLQSIPKYLNGSFMFSYLLISLGYILTECLINANTWIIPLMTPKAVFFLNNIMYCFFLLLRIYFQFSRLLLFSYLVSSVPLFCIRQNFFFHLSSIFDTLIYYFIIYPSPLMFLSLPPWQNQIT